MDEMDGSGRSGQWRAGRAAGPCNVPHGTLALVRAHSIIVTVAATALTGRMPTGAVGHVNWYAPGATFENMKKPEPSVIVERPAPFSSTGTLSSGLPALSFRYPAMTPLSFLHDARGGGTAAG